jgi:hypothetical protein
VWIATAIFSRCLPNLSRSSALFLHGLPVKSLPCLQPGMTFQNDVSYFSLEVQAKWDFKEECVISAFRR